MNDRLRTLKNYYIAVIVSLCMFTGLNAKTTLDYEQWKLQQQRHDERLASEPLLTEFSSSLPLSISRQMAVVSTPNGLAPAEQQVLGRSLKVNINLATAQELSAKLDSIGLKKAQAIVEYRKQHGAFKKIEDLKNVKGIGDKIFARNQDRLKLTD